jgi:phage tail-like protein
VADPNLLRAFRFRITLMASPTAPEGASSSSGAPLSSTGAGVAAGVSAAAGFGVSATAGAGASASAGVGATAGAGAVANASFGASAGASVSASANASLGAFAGASASLGAGTGSALGNGAFAECSGLEIEMEVADYQEGGRNDGIIRRAGRARYQPLVLKRGMVYPTGAGANPEVWNWIQAVLGGVRPITRYDGIVEVMSVGDTVSARWVFARGLPAKVSGPQLNARTGEVAIEELHIAHEGLRMVAL